MERYWFAGSGARPRVVPDYKWRSSASGAGLQVALDRKRRRSPWGTASVMGRDGTAYGTAPLMGMDSAVYGGEGADHGERHRIFRYPLSG